MTKRRIKSKSSMQTWYAKKFCGLPTPIFRGLKQTNNECVCMCANSRKSKMAARQLAFILTTCSSARQRPRAARQFRNFPPFFVSHGTMRAIQVVPPPIFVAERTKTRWLYGELWMCHQRWLLHFFYSSFQLEVIDYFNALALWWNTLCEWLYIIWILC